MTISFSYIRTNTLPLRVLDTLGESDVDRTNEVEDGVSLRLMYEDHRGKGGHPQGVSGTRVLYLTRRTQILIGRNELKIQTPRHLGFD